MVKRKRTFQSSQTKKMARTISLNRGVKRFPNSILASQQRATLRYSETNSVSVPASTDGVGIYVFSANGLFDPNDTGVGHQPRGFDQLMALYDHYTVLSARINVRFLNEGNPRAYTFISVRDGNTPVLSFNDLMEGSTKVVSKKPLSRVTEENQSNYLTTGVTIGNFLGRANVMSDPDCKGSAAGNPAEQVFFHVGASDPTTSNSGSVSFTVEIIYNVVFHEPKTPGQS